MKQVQERKSMRRYSKTIDIVRGDDGETVVEDVRPDPTFKLSQLIWWVVGVLNALLLLRFLFLLIDARPVSFVQVIYDLTDSLVSPFTAIVSPEIGSGVFDIPSLVAIVVVTLIGGIITSFTRIAEPTNHTF